MIRTALLLAAALALVLAPAPVRADPDQAAAWELGTSDFARFERQKATLDKEGKEKLGGPSVVTVHGSDLPGGLYLPESPRRGDLPALLALRLRRTGDESWRVPFVDTVEVQLDGRFSCAPTAESTELRATWKFASRGRGEGDWVIRDGTGTTTTVVDAERVPVRARVTFRYLLQKRDPGKGDEPKAVDETWVFERKDLRRARYEQFHADVGAAIDRGLAHLRSLQKDDGTFEPEGGWDVGTTALAVYTTLACGVPRDDERVAKALAWIASRDVKRNYELSLGLMAIERAYVEPGNTAAEEAQGKSMPRELRAWCEQAAQRLEQQCAAPGSWGYPNAGNELYKMDSSNTQYAVLGLRAAARIGIAVREQTWIGVVRHFLLCREKDGPKGAVSLAPERGSSTVAATDVKSVAGFRYRPHEPRAHGSMTCAGIASLAIARDELRRAGSKKFGKADEAEVEDAIAGGWAWIAAHYAVDRHPLKNRDWYHYWLYALERAGLLTGVARVDGRDWYFDGAMELLARQGADGSWDEPGGGHTPETCFALLFLKRATAPVAAVTGK